MKMKNLIIATSLSSLFGCASPATNQAETPTPTEPIISSNTESRSYFDLQEEAKAASENEEWQQCVNKYEDAAAATTFTTNQMPSYYNAACCAAVSGQADAAFRLLEQAVATGFDNTAHLAKDDDLVTLHSDSRWEPLLEKAAALAEQQWATHNPELVEVFYADQADRQSGDPTDIFKRDAERRQKVAAILDAGGAKVGQDYYHAAMIFQHGNEVADIERAHELANKGLELDPNNGKIAWLVAATLDRALMKKGEPQRYGTQFSLDPQTETWILYPWDPAVTDAERAALNVPPLRVAQQRAEQMNAVPNP